MIITCTQCDKKLTVRDELAGKKVRCPGCKGLIAVPKPNDDTTEIVAPVKPKRRTEAHTEDTVVDPAWAKKVAAKKSEAIEDDAPPKKMPGKANVEDEEDEEDEPDDAPSDAMRCAKCDSSKIESLPPDRYSRRPGFICKKCGARMRPPGSTAFYLFSMVLGVAAILIGIAVVIVIFMVERFNKLALTGALMMPVIGVGVISWAFKQMQLPAPRNAPPIRWVLWIGVTLAVLFFGSLIVGGCLFGFAYFLHEML